jgi:anti-sigma B factor antagonist
VAGTTSHVAVSETFSWARHSVDGEVEMFVLRGELDSASAPGLRAEVRRLFEDGARHSIVFDLAGVSFVDSVGLGVFFATHRMAERCGGAVALSGAPSPVRGSLESTGLDRTLFVAPTRADAIIYLSRASHGHTDALEQAREDAAGF